MAADEEERVELQALTGRTLGGKYQLTGMIASGGFGAVFEAVQMPLGRRVAVKVNLHGHQPAMRARFKREADVLTRLRHPGIVQLLDYGEEIQPDFGPLFYMVQEYVAGESLKTLLARTPRLPPGEVVAIADELLIALGEAHRLGVVHRDIKPGNLMIATEPGGRRAIRVLDFGISKAQEVDDDLGTLTATGAFLGTPAYMAPEQCQHQAVSPATDIYAVGVLLFRMLAGELPFRANNLWGYLSQHIEAPVPRLPADVPPVFGAIIERAMAKAPAERFTSTEDLREALLDAVPGAGTRRPAPRPPSASLPPLPSELQVGSSHSGTAPYGTGTTAPSGRPEPPASSLAIVPTLDTAYGEGTTGGPMVMERPAERRPRGWVAVLAIAGIALAVGLTALNIDESTDAEVPSRIQSVSADVPAAGDAATSTVDARPMDRGAAPIDVAVDAAAASQDAAAKKAVSRERRRRRPPARRASAARPKPPTAAPTAQPVTTPRPAPSADQLSSDFDRQITQCNCSKARSRLEALRQVDPPGAAIKARRYEEECEMRLPGNCRSR